GAPSDEPRTERVLVLDPLRRSDALLVVIRRHDRLPLSGTPLWRTAAGPPAKRAPRTASPGQLWEPPPRLRRRLIAVGVGDAAAFLDPFAGETRAVIQQVHVRARIVIVGVRHFHGGPQMLAAGTRRHFFRLVSGADNKQGIVQTHGSS